MGELALMQLCFDLFLGAVINVDILFFVPLPWGYCGLEFSTTE
jgi:hypothetical protein